MPTKVVRTAYVMPTLNRSHLHEQAYEQFARQVGAGSKHLYVYDESREPSPFFSKRRSADVTYVHRVGSRPNGVTRIGAARNAINSLVREPVIIHFDDDDLLHPEYGITLASRLGDADVAKLDVWRLITDNNDRVFEWDTRKFGGWHFCLRGETSERVRADEDMSPEERDAYRDAFHIGFGWSLAYKTDLWRRFRFPEEGTEDIPWMRKVRDAGARIVFVSDCAHLALHTVHVDPNHPEGGSPHFPQRLLGKLNERMLGAAMAMEQLPEGKPVKIVPGETYRVLAMVKKTHSLAAVTARAAGWGIDVKEAQDNVAPPTGVKVPDGYRLVEYVGSGTRPVTLPWQAPKMLRVLGENSRLVGAWIGAGTPEDPVAVFLRVFDLRMGSGARTKQTDEVMRTYASAIMGASQVVEYVRADDPHPHPSGHVCSVASSAGVARQLDPRWRYAGTVTKAERDTMRASRAVITSPGGGQKNIPIWWDNRLPDGGYNRGPMPMRLVLQCPYSGQLFLFQKQPTVESYSAAIGAGTSQADQLLAQAQAYLASAQGWWDAVQAVIGSSHNPNVGACQDIGDASASAPLQATSSSACSAAQYAIRAAQQYASRCPAAASAAANAKPCPGLDLSAEHAQGSPWGTVFTGQVYCLDPNLVPQVGAQVSQAQASVAAAQAARDARCPVQIRPAVRSLRIGAGLSSQDTLANYGLSQIAQSAGSYALDEASALTGFPPSVIVNVVGAITTGDPVQIGQAAMSATIFTISTVAPVAGAAIGAAILIVEWLAGQNSPPPPPPPCSVECDPSNPNCNIGDTWWHGDASNALLCGWAPGDIVPGSFEEYMGNALMSVYAQWMSLAPPGSLPPDDVSGKGVPDLCWVVKKGLDPQSYAVGQMAAAFPQLLLAWNETHAPANLVRQKYPNAIGLNGPRTFTVYEPPAGASPWAGYETECSPIGATLLTYARGAGLPGNSTITFNVNSDFTYADLGMQAPPAKIPGPIRLGGGGGIRLGGGGSGGGDSHPLATAGLIVGGTAVAAAAGVGVYAWRTKRSYGKAWRHVLDMLRDQATKAGQSLSHAGARERRRRRR